MPDPLYRNTSRNYAQFNMNIPDQFRATQLIAELSPMKTLPRSVPASSDGTRSRLPAAMDAG